jgi:hypothetical protein
MRTGDAKYVQLKCSSCGRGGKLAPADDVNPFAKVGDEVAWETACPSCEAKGARFEVEAFHDSDPNAERTALYAGGPSRRCVEENLADLRRIAADDGGAVVREYVDVGGSARRDQLAKLLADAAHEDAEFSAVLVRSYGELGRDLASIRSVVSDLRDTGVRVTSADGFLVNGNADCPVLAPRLKTLVTEDAEALAETCGAIAAARIRAEHPDEYETTEEQVLDELSDELAMFFPAGAYASEDSLNLPCPEGHFLDGVAMLTGQFVEDLEPHFWRGFRAEVIAAASLGQPRVAGRGS